MAHFDDIAFEDAEIGNAQFLECAFTSVTFSGGSYRHLRGLHAQRPRPRRRNAEPRPAPWFNAAAVRLAQAKLDDVDFRGARGIGLADGYDALRGAVIDTTQLMEIAPALASVIGITVSDETP